MSILIPTGILDPPLLEVEMNKFNSDHMSVEEI